MAPLRKINGAGGGGFSFLLHHQNFMKIKTAYPTLKSVFLKL